MAIESCKKHPAFLYNHTAGAFLWLRFWYRFRRFSRLFLSTQRPPAIPANHQKLEVSRLHPDPGMLTRPIPAQAVPLPTAHHTLMPLVSRTRM